MDILAQALVSAIDNILNDMGQDLAHYKNSPELQKNEPGLDEIYQDRIPLIEKWKKLSEQAKMDNSFVYSDEYRHFLGEATSIGQGFDDSFDWSTFAKRINIDVALIYNISKQIQLKKLEKEVPVSLVSGYEKLKFEYLGLA